MTVACVSGIRMETGLGGWEIGVGGDLEGGPLPDGYPLQPLILEGHWQMLGLESLLLFPHCSWWRDP